MSLSSSTLSLATAHGKYAKNQQNHSLSRCKSTSSAGHIKPETSPATATLQAKFFFTNNAHRPRHPLADNALSLRNVY